MTKKTSPRSFFKLTFTRVESLDEIKQGDHFLIHDDAHLPKELVHRAEQDGVEAPGDDNGGYVMSQPAGHINENGVGDGYVVPRDKYGSAAVEARKKARLAKSKKKGK